MARPWIRSFKKEDLEYTIPFVDRSLRGSCKTLRRGTHCRQPNDVQLSQPQTTRLSVALWPLGIAGLIGLGIASLVVWMRMERLKRSAGATATESVGRARRPTWIFHPLLIAAYPILQLFGQNVEELPVAHIIYPLAVSVVAGVTIFGLRGGLCSVSRSAIVASLTCPRRVLRAGSRLREGRIPFLGDPSVHAWAWAIFSDSSRACVGTRCDRTTHQALNVFALKIGSGLVSLRRILRSDDVRRQPPSSTSRHHSTASWSCRG